MTSRIRPRPAFVLFGIALTMLLFAGSTIPGLPVEASNSGPMAPGSRQFDTQITPLPNWTIESIEVLPEGGLYANETDVEVWVSFDNVGGSGGTQENSVLIYLEVLIGDESRKFREANYSHNPGLRRLVWDAPLPQGDYFINATIDADGNQAESNEGDNSLNARISVLAPRDNNPPPVPALIYPRPGQELSDHTPRLRWRNVADPEGNGEVFDVQVSTTSSFSPVDRSISDTNTASYTVDPPLSSGWYFWRVRSKDLAGNVGVWTTTRRFRVKEPAITVTINSNPPGAR